MSTVQPSASQLPQDGHFSAPGSNDRFVTCIELPLLNKCRIHMVGISTWAAPSRSFSRCHQLPQFVAVTGGRGEFWFNGDWHRAGAGCLFVCPPGCAAGARVKTSRKLEFVAILYAREAATAAIDAPALLQADVWGLAHAAGGLLREWSQGAPPAVLECLVDLLHVQATRLMRQHPAPGRLADLWETVEQDISRPWTLERMASLVDMSEQHLSRLCHSEYGDSPAAHLAKLRMRRAGQLLLATELSIAAVAALVGYQSQFAFSNAFKRHFDSSPTLYRRANKGR